PPSCAAKSRNGPGSSRPPASTRRLTENIAMARVPLLGEERSDLAPFIARVKTERGRLINLYRVLMNSPRIAAAWLDFNSAVRYGTTLDAALREMIILRVSLLNGAEYQARIHGSGHALKAGVTPEQVA